jgi:hypothetical protein
VSVFKRSNLVKTINSEKGYIHRHRHRHKGRHTLFSSIKACRIKKLYQVRKCKTKAEG